MKYEKPEITFSCGVEEDVLTASGEIMKDDWDGFDPNWLLQGGNEKW